MPISAPKPTRSQRSASRGSVAVRAGQRRDVGREVAVERRLERARPRPGARTAPARRRRGPSAGSYGDVRAGRRAAAARSTVVSAVTSSPSGVRDRVVHGDRPATSPPRSYSAGPRGRRRCRRAPARGRAAGSAPAVSACMVVVVAVRLVRLEHGELGVVGGVGALVAEVAVRARRPARRRRPSAA